MYVYTACILCLQDNTHTTITSHKVKINCVYVCDREKEARVCVCERERVKSIYSRNRNGNDDIVELQVLLQQLVLHIDVTRPSVLRWPAVD